MSRDLAKQEKFVEHILFRLKTDYDLLKKQWNRPEGTKTRHFYIDNLLPLDDVTSIYASFPKNADGFFDRESFRERKSTSADLSSEAPILTDITYAIQDSRIVEMVGEICGMGKVEPDPKLYAGGLSMMFRDDFLNPHIDNSHDVMRNKYRRLNLLYYVSPDWELENGGNFELWSADRKTPKTIVAFQNRLVVMETNRSSWHSVSKVKTDNPRCCVSNYYFSSESPDGDSYFHVTSFSGRPEQPFRRAFGALDNVLRNIVSKTIKIGRGRKKINKVK